MKVTGEQAELMSESARIILREFCDDYDGVVPLILAQVVCLVTMFILHGSAPGQEDECIEDFVSSLRATVQEHRRTNLQ